ncbi:MAG: MarR family transcriptional regulator [Ignavibacteria bacterium]|nr:MarR family transcriptional regulator [Ignavibacteria bacterium]
MSSAEERIRKELIQRFGEAYKSFGLNKLMGHVVALLIYAPEPLSLTEIAKLLGRSKGPVSQILRRLRDHKLVRKAWSPEDNRSDFYEIEPEIFENAFRNNLELIKNNSRLAKQLKEKVHSVNKKNNMDILYTRVEEMEMFYKLMEKHYRNFLTEWNDVRSKQLGL